MKVDLQVLFDFCADYRKTLGDDEKFREAIKKKDYLDELVGSVNRSAQLLVISRLEQLLENILKGKKYD